MFINVTLLQFYCTLLATVHRIIILKGYFEMSVYVFNRKVKFVFNGNYEKITSVM